jgi:hypothetical protein
LNYFRQCWAKVGVVVEQIELNNVMLYRQPQRHCKNAVKKQVLVNHFGFTKTCFVLVLQGTSQNFLPKLFFFSITNQNFDENSHCRSETKIAKTSLTGTKPTYIEIKKKRKNGKNELDYVASREKSSRKEGL